MSMEEIPKARSGALQSLGMPKSIAIAGASVPGSGGYYGAKLMANVVGAGTTAKVYPVNPRLAGQEILGHRAYASLSDLPEVPDIVIFATPAAAVSAGLREAAALGVRTSVVITSVDEASLKAFDAEVRDIALASGMRIIGPNSMGIMNGAAALNGSFASGLGGTIPNGPLAFLSQSGAIISCMLQRDRGTNLGYSWLISTGNEAATSIEQIFHDIVEDDNVGVIMLFVEGVRDGTLFRKAALRAQLAGKPVVLLKAGVSESGRHAVESHTGRMAGTREVFRAVAEEAGVQTADSFAEFFACARALRDTAPTHGSQPHGRRAIVISNSGGLTTVSADHLSALGWTLPSYLPEVREAVEREARKQGVLNPADIPGSWADNPRMARVLREASRQPDIDAIFIISGAGGDQAKNVASEILKVIPEIPQEVYVSWLGATAEMRAEYEAAGRTIYDDSWAAIQAAEASARFRCAQQRRAGTQALLRGLEAVSTTEAAAGTERVWTAGETLESARAAGVPTLPSAVSSGLDAAEVSALAERIGYPVALKIQTEAISHKTDMGGVRLGIADGAAVQAVVADFARIAAGQGIADARVLVQKMVSGVEVLVGIKRDPAFGPILFLGAGGIFAELQSDLVGIPLPSPREEIARKLAGHAVLGKLLAGYRGAPPADREALIDAINAIGRWAVGLGAGLQEADFNPVMVTDRAAIAVDGRAIVRS